MRATRFAGPRYCWPDAGDDFGVPRTPLDGFPGRLADENLEPSRPDVEALAGPGGDLGEALARRLDVEERAVLRRELELDHRARRADVREARPDPASPGVVVRPLHHGRAGGSRR